MPSTPPPRPQGVDAAHLDTVAALAARLRSLADQVADPVVRRAIDACAEDLETAVLKTPDVVVRLDRVTEELQRVDRGSGEA